MAAAKILSAPPKCLTYEAYLEKPESNLRYDIIDGIKEFMAGVADSHQEIAMNLAEAFRAYTRESGVGKAIVAPRDVLISKVPLRVHQPDVLLVSWERRRQNPKAEEAAPMSPAPELVVEILSPSDRKSVLRGKIEDYLKVDVRQCWIVDRKSQTVEVVSLEAGAEKTAGVYPSGETVFSIAFPGLSVSGAAVLAD